MSPHNPSPPQKKADKTPPAGVRLPALSKKIVLGEGDLDANWIESMNSVMDDNRLLTLPSNERIPLKAMDGGKDYCIIIYIYDIWCIKSHKGVN